MKKAKIQLKISGEDLKKKLKIVDGKDGAKGDKGDKGERGDTPDTSVVALEASKMVLEEVKKEIPTVKQIEEDITGEQVRDKLEDLKGKERLDKDAIRGLDDYDEISKLAKREKVVKNYYGGAGLDEKVKVSSNDTTAKYAEDAFTAGTGLSKTTLNEGSNEQVQYTNTDRGSTAVTSHESTYDHTTLGGTFYEGTKAQILALSVSTYSGKFAYGTDTTKIYYCDGTNWREYELPLQVKNPADIGAEQESGLNGFHPDYVTDKLIANCTVGDNANTTTGGIRMYGNYIQAYLAGGWKTIVTGFVFNEDSTEQYELEHDPLETGNYYEVATGDSQAKSSNGYPFTQQYRTGIGAMGERLKVGGGATTPTKNQQYLNGFPVAIEPRSDLTETQIISGNPTMPFHDMELVQSSDTQRLFVIEQTATPEWVPHVLQTLDLAVSFNDEVVLLNDEIIYNI